MSCDKLQVRLKTKEANTPACLSGAQSNCVILLQNERQG